MYIILKIACSAEGIVYVFLFIHYSINGQIHGGGGPMAIAFKADLHLLHLRAAFHEHIGDTLGALRDCRAALSVDPNHQEMLELHSRVNSHEP